MPGDCRRVMRVDEIPDFVEDVIAAGCDITAVGDGYYVLGETDDQEQKCFLELIAKKYGDRDPVRLQIVSYLRSIGRFLDVTLPETRH